MADKEKNTTTSETTGSKEVIILNKPFLGGWLDEEGRIGHEIIDFFLADNGKYYVYNNPHGTCPDEIWVGDSEKNDYGLDRTDGEQYVAKYMVLTSDAHATDNDDIKNNFETKKSQPKDFKILYVIKLKEKIHRYNTGKDEVKGLKAGQGKFENINLTKNYPKSVAKIITDEGITYNGQALNEIYGEDESLYLTFEAEAIYKVKEDETLLFESQKYNFQRNKGYLWSDTDNKHNTKEDYDALANELKYEIDLVDKKDSSGKLEKMELKRLTKPEENNSDGENNSYEKKTFLDLIGFTYNEQAFTNMLYALLKNNEVFNRFCKECAVGGKTEFIEGNYTVSREKTVENGRMDICGESDWQRVIIENKIYSGLNGIKLNDKGEETSQLSTYYNKWGWGKDNEPLCLITAPDYRKAEIEVEIKEFDKEMDSKYHIITYSKIADFFDRNKNWIKDIFKKEGNELINPLYEQIVDAFRKWSYKNKEDLYASMFLAATEEAKKRKQ